MTCMHACMHAWLLTIYMVTTPACRRIYTCMSASIREIDACIYVVNRSIYKQWKTQGVYFAASGKSIRRK